MSHAATLPTLLPPRAAPGKHVALVLTVLVHLLLGFFLVYGIRWQTRPPEAVEVELVRAAPAAPPEPAPQHEPAPRREAAPVVEERPAPVKPDIAVKEKPKPPKEAPAPKPDAFQDQARRDLENLGLNKEVASASEELSRLRTAQAAAQAAAARSKAEGNYVAKIKGKIKGNIVRPPDIVGNPEAIFDVTQLPTGEILAVKLMKSSGNAALDAAIERAILKSSPLPLPERGDLFQRSLELRFKPLED